MKIEVAKEAQTGFPCMRYDDKQEFIALLPVTKLQVEEWVWRSGEAPLEGARFAHFVDRLEVQNIGEQFPQAVQFLTRQPIESLNADTLLSLVATNLSLWNIGEEAQPVVSFPTPKSEWGQLLGWLGGRIPDDREWAVTVDDLRAIPTQAIIRKVLSSHIQWDQVVKDLLGKIEEALPDNAVGLPFMKQGLYELVIDTEKVQRLVEYQRLECRPKVAGDSPIWPSLDSAEHSLELARYRSLRRHTLPVVAVRLWYASAEVTGELNGKKYACFDIEKIQSPKPRAASVPAPESTRSQDQYSFLSWFRKKPKAHAQEERKLPPYVAPPETMKHKCMVCYKPVEPLEVFNSASGFYCYIVREAVKNADGIETVEVRRKHNIEYPREEKGQVWDIEHVPRRYLETARARPRDVHVVALSGFPASGKTTWLLSLGGLLDYEDEDGNPLILGAFPEAWNYLHIPCSAGPLRANRPTDRKLWTEKMWLDGLLPPRNSANDKAFRCPIRFSRSRGKGEQVFLPIFNDKAGDVLVQMEVDYNVFPHITATSDALFFMTATQINIEFIQRFIHQMDKARDAGFVVDLNKINLIFIFSKIDQLKYGDKKERELFNCILPRPYRFPRERNEHDLKAYLDEMEEVHFRIEDWIWKYKRLLLGYTKLFRSVRYCGLSAFGFQPQKEQGLEVEYSLPFCPEPVRVIDPLFWLFKENHWIEF